jgi:Holliday junction resolvasome RuvABC endonuclease subunit
MSRKRTKKTIRVHVPKSLYQIYLGIAGGDDKKLQRLIRRILEKELETNKITDLVAVVRACNQAVTATTERGNGTP